MRGSRQAEEALHQQLSQDRIRGEWYDPTSPTVEALIRDLDNPSSERVGVPQLLRDNSYAVGRGKLSAESVGRTAQEELSKAAEERRLLTWEASKRKAEEAFEEMKANPISGRYASKVRFIERQVANLDQKIRKSSGES